MLRLICICLLMSFIIVAIDSDTGAAASEPTRNESVQQKLEAERARSAALLKAIEDLSAKLKLQYPPEIRAQLIRKQADLELGYKDARLAQYGHFKKMQSFDEGVFQWQQTASNWVLWPAAGLVDTLLS